MYHFSTMLSVGFEEAIALVTAALAQEGFGVLTEIDAQAAFKKKLGVDFRRYTILGACHPQVAHAMLQLDDKAGVLFPCNVVVQARDNGRVEVSAIDPLAMFAVLSSPQAREIAEEASQSMQAVMARLSAAQPAAV
ncbi:DUF302 domain-containing protein [Leptolyngbya sp. KIOST-1]|uniref:DUF302 domain-containing protein n=1 Tax=Leptolyngbya sp. KIOST-1 TaxID=1229172 RepID=UPI00056B976B|nr:DUF302 domain-containing protein [Leptolyngbya sp. KIOST-1]